MHRVNFDDEDDEHFHEQDEGEFELNEASEPNLTTRRRKALEETNPMGTGFPSDGLSQPSDVQNSDGEEEGHSSRCAHGKTHCHECGNLTPRTASAGHIGGEHSKECNLPSNRCQNPMPHMTSPSLHEPSWHHLVPTMRSMVEECEAQSSWLGLPRALKDGNRTQLRLLAMRHRALRWGANAAAPQQGLRKGVARRR